MFPGKNIKNIAKSNRIFPGKGRDDKDFILTYLDSSMAEVFPHCCLFFLPATSGENFDNIGPYWGRARKPPKNGSFVDSESLRKILEIFNLTTTNAILMKFTTLMYLHERVNQKALSVIYSFFGLI